MKKTLRVILPSLFIIFLTANLSFGQLGISGELRTRPEYRRGLKTLASPGQDPAFFVSQRTRLKFNYGGERMRFFMTLQDVRTWGSTSQLNLSDDFLSLHEAWGELVISDHFFLKAGRQELAYDDHRILGNVDWAQQGRSHDLVLLRFENKNFKWHTGFAYNQDKEQFSTTYYSVGNSYKTMQFTWLHSEFENIKGSILLLNNGVQLPDSTTSYSQTLGSYMNVNIGNLNMNLAGYYQMGKDNSNRKLSAGYVFSEISWPFDSGLIPSIGFEFLSGTDQDNTLINHSFLPLYGTNHKFNGHMDYFYVGNHANNVGLWDPYLRLVFKKGNWTANGTLHHFSSAARILDPVNPSTALKNALGTELDLSLSWNITGFVSLSGGYSQLFATSSMEAIKGGDHTTANQWAWLMLSFKPNLLQPD